MPHIARDQNRTVPRDSRSAAKSQDRAAPRVPCPAASSKPSGTSSPMPCDPTSRTNGAADSTPHDHHHRQTAPQTSLPSLCGKAGATPSPRLAAKPERRRAPASRPKQRGTAEPHPAEKRSGAAGQPRGQDRTSPRSPPPASRTRQIGAAVSTPPCLTDKADRRRGRASRLVAKKLTCPRANYLTNALSSANGITTQARGVEGGPQQFASATRKAKPEGSRPETPPNTTPQRTVK